MPELFGLECANPACVHDTARGYKLHFRVRPIGVPEGVNEAEWRAHLASKDANGNSPAGFMTERNPITFRANQLDAAYAQMDLLGGRPIIGAQLIERHASLPPGYDARLLMLREVPLPRVALYFRWQPEAGELLTPDKVFQCIFMPGASAAERRNASERQLTEDEFNHVVRRQIPGRIVQMTRDSLIRCHHCHQALPLRAFTTLTLRETEKGE